MVFIKYVYCLSPTDCKLNIHRPCSKILEENCPGPLPQAKRKDKDLHNDNKISKLIMGKIRPRTSTDMSGGKFLCF